MLTTFLTMLPAVCETINELRFKPSANFIWNFLRARTRMKLYWKR